MLSNKSKRIYSIFCFLKSSFKDIERSPKDDQCPTKCAALDGYETGHCGITGLDKPKLKCVCYFNVDPKCIICK